jgi:hypothetical protein
MRITAFGVFRDLVQPWQDRASERAGRAPSAPISPEDALMSALPAAPRVRAVVFDVGETLIDETTEYGTWADWLGVPRHTFSATFGAVIARGDDYRQTFQHFRPGFELAAERLRRDQADFPEHFDEHDLYPDARPCLES